MIFEIVHTVVLNKLHSKFFQTLITQYSEINHYPNHATPGNFVPILVRTNENLVITSERSDDIL